MKEIDRELFGPIYRSAPLTVADYDEAIEDLQTARNNLEKYGVACACDDCWHSDCRHNPLAVARHVALRPIKWRCFHCGEVFVDEDQAREHFGQSEDEPAACLPSPPQAKEGK